VNNGASVVGTGAAGRGGREDLYAWQSLFDGHSLAGWQVPVFGGDGEVTVKDGAIELGLGASLTGVTWTGEPPRTNYELALEAMRIDGVDFFATTTFPVGEDCCSLVVGGWGGAVVGLSNVDYYDASDNVTTRFQSFDDRRWYRIRIRVSDARIQAWIDDEPVVDLARAGHTFDVRVEVELCKPLGIAAWCTRAAVRDVRLRRLVADEAAPLPVELPGRE